MNTPTSRRELLKLWALWPAWALAGQGTTGEALRFGITAVFLNNQIALLEAWRNYLSETLAQPVLLVQQASYGAIVDLLLRKQLDAAWLCGYPFVLHQRHLDLVAAPIYRGQSLYKSLLIVPSDSKASSLSDLRGGSFAYSDPLSNSGYLVPLGELLDRGTDSRQFFRKAFFAGGHSNVVSAVAHGLAEGGAVDSYVWETLGQRGHNEQQQTRVVWQSPDYGFPPVIVRKDLPGRVTQSFKNALLGMAQSEKGRALLQQLNLDGFAVVSPSLYSSIDTLRLRVEPGSTGRV